MNRNTLIIVGFTIGIVACAEKNQTVPEESSAAEPAVSAVEPNAAPAEDWRNSAFMDHMHAHAERLDDLNYALSDDNLERAKAPAYWLSRHKEVTGLPEDLQPFVVRMREAAQSVEAAEDLAAARAASQRIVAECQGCHTAVGVAAQ